ncbi:MAG: flagellar biosynthetic protein FliO [Miltoncostaeaceae bacterium]
MPTTLWRRTRLTPAGRVCAWSLTAIAAALALPALAAAQANDPESQPIPDGSSAPTVISEGSAGSGLRLVIGLAVVIGLIAVVWWVLKRVQANRFPQGEGGGDVVSIIATTPLGPNRALHLIEVAGELVLVGATDHGITPVARITGDPTRDALELGAPEMATPGAPTAFDPRGQITDAAEGRLVDRLRALTAR